MSKSKTWKNRCFVNVSNEVAIEITFSIRPKDNKPEDINSGTNNSWSLN